MKSRDRFYVYQNALQSQNISSFVTILSICYIIMLTTVQTKDDKLSWSLVKTAHSDARHTHTTTHGCHVSGRTRPNQTDPGECMDDPIRSIFDLVDPLPGPVDRQSCHWEGLHLRRLSGPILWISFKHYVNSYDLQNWRGLKVGYDSQSPTLLPSGSWHPLLITCRWLDPQVQSPAFYDFQWNVEAARSTRVRWLKIDSGGGGGHLRVICKNWQNWNHRI